MHDKEKIEKASRLTQEAYPLLQGSPKEQLCLRKEYTISDLNP